MGWDGKSGLGKNKEGRTKPLPLHVRAKSLGLGYQRGTSSNTAPASSSSPGGVADSSVSSQLSRFQFSDFLPDSSNR
eukprot:g54575.t1